MPNKTIYVSEKDATLFEEAKEIAGEALSSVIVRAISEFVSRSREMKKGNKNKVFNQCQVSKSEIALILIQPRS